MTATLMKGKPLAERIRAEVAEEVRRLGHIGLVTVLVGDDPASEVYIRLKHKAAVEAGFDATDLRLPAETSEDDLLAKLDELNRSEEIDAILVQLPLPKHIDEARIIRAVTPAKDVDGFHPLNAGELYLGRPAIVSATPLGVMALLAEHGFSPHSQSSSSLSKKLRASSAQWEIPVNLISGGRSYHLYEGGQCRSHFVHLWVSELRALVAPVRGATKQVRTQAVALDTLVTHMS